jgi:hypothetical protein
MQKIPESVRGDGQLYSHGAKSGKRRASSAEFGIAVTKPAKRQHSASVVVEMTTTATEPVTAAEREGPESSGG